MAQPTGIRLLPGQLIITLVDADSDGTVPTSENLAYGQVQSSYSDQMAYSNGQKVLFERDGQKSFTQGGVEYFIVDQLKVQSQVDIELP